MKKNNEEGLYICKKCRGKLKRRFGFWLYCGDCNFYREYLKS